MSKESDHSELAEIWGEAISQIDPAVQKILLSALKKAKEKLAKKIT